jgi:hypothetical protein
VALRVDEGYGHCPLTGRSIAGIIQDPASVLRIVAVHDYSFESLPAQLPDSQFRVGAVFRLDSQISKHAPQHVHDVPVRTQHKRAQVHNHPIVGGDLFPGKSLP